MQNVSSQILRWAPYITPFLTALLGFVAGALTEQRQQWLAVRRATRDIYLLLGRVLHNTLLQQQRCEWELKEPESDEARSDLAKDAAEAIDLYMRSLSLAVFEEYFEKNRLVFFKIPNADVLETFFKRVQKIKQEWRIPTVEFPCNSQEFAGYSEQLRSPSRAVIDSLDELIRQEDVDFKKLLRELRKVGSVEGRRIENLLATRPVLSDS